VAVPRSRSCGDLTIHLLGVIAALAMAWVRDLSRLDLGNLGIGIFSGRPNPLFVGSQSAARSLRGLGLISPAGTAHPTARQRPTARITRAGKS